MSQGCRSLGGADHRVVGAIASLASAKISGLTPQETALVARRGASSAHLGEAPSVGVAAAAPTKVACPSARDLSSLAWSCAKVLFRTEPLIDVIAAGSVNRISEFSIVGLANVAWSCARLLLPH
mmetsp:Transcript_65069/g.212089  ORF Transcript_65069/g.212089 Transcript_65069/m.212089 type:complete len:124 (+) Transcript_65069:1104-1475(+)